MESAEDFMTDYGDASGDVSNSTHQSFDGCLQRWFDLIDSNPASGQLEKSLEGRINFKAWIKEQFEAGGGRMGGNLTWPRQREDFLGMRLALLRAFSKGETEALSFGHHFLYSGRSLDDTIRAVVDHIFEPTARDFLKLVERTIRDLGDGSAALASDRIVRRSDNSEKFDEAVEAADRVASALHESNSFPDVEDKQRLIAEIAAGRDLMKAARIRTEAIRATIWSALAWVIRVASENLIGTLALAALTALASLFGFIPFW